MRLAVRLAMQPFANRRRALAMSTRRRQHRHADRLDRLDLGRARATARRRGRESSGRRRRRCRGCAPGNVPSRWTSMKRGSVEQRPRRRDGRVEPLGVADARAPRPTRAAAAIICVGFGERSRHRLLDEHRHARARGTAARRRRCDSVGTAIVTASTWPSSSRAVVDARACRCAAAISSRARAD